MKACGFAALTFSICAETPTSPGGAQHHRRLGGEYLVGELHRELRAGLVVVENQMQRPAADAAVLVHVFLAELQGLLLRLAEERRIAGERQDDVDVVAVRRLDR